MDNSKFHKLVDDFEKNIIVEGIVQRRFCKRTKIPIRNCKLANHEFGKRLGDIIDTDIILVIDYYGYLKRSKGFIHKVKSEDKSYSKELKSYIVHFASIKMEDIAAMTSNIAVMLDFPRLKNEILILRGFKKPSQIVSSL